MINLIPTTRKNPKTGNRAWYLKCEQSVPVGSDALYQRIQSQCTITRHDLKAVVSALEDSIINNLKEGRSVRLGDLGSFRLTVSSEPSETVKGCDCSKVKAVKVQFTPGSAISNSMRIGPAQELSLHVVNDGIETA